MSRNVVLVTVDSLRADYRELGGDVERLTPTLDELAQEGITFDNAISPGPRTPSSAPVFHTGRFMAPSDCEWTWRTRRQRIREHLQRHETIAEYFSKRGYTTIGLSTNPWTHGTGFDRGFDKFVELTADDMQSPSIVFKLLDSIMDVGRLGDEYNWQNKREWFVQWQQQYPHIEAVLEEAREDEPYFVWLFLLDTHQPYITPSAYRKESNVFEMYYAAYREHSRGAQSPTGEDESRLLRAYRDAIRSTDAFVARLREDLSEDDPIFVFHSDHGEAFGEHDTFGHEPYLYEENLRVPLIVSGLNQSDSVSSPFSLRRLPDLLSAFTNSETTDPEQFTEPFVSATIEDGSRWAIRGNQWKYIEGERQQLYDLSGKPREQEDLLTDAPEVAHQLHRLLNCARADTEERNTIKKTLDGFGEERRKKEAPL